MRKTVFHYILLMGDFNYRNHFPTEKLSHSSGTKNAKISNHAFSENISVDAKDTQHFVVIKLRQVFLVL